RFVLVERAEERLARHDVHVDACLMVVPVVVAERWLRPLMLGHLVLQWRERVLELRVTQLFEGHRIPSSCAALRGADPSEGRERRGQPEHQPEPRVNQRQIHGCNVTVGGGNRKWWPPD